MVRYRRFTLFSLLIVGLSSLSCPAWVMSKQLIGHRGSALIMRSLSPGWGCMIGRKDNTLLMSSRWWPPEGGGVCNIAVDWLQGKYPFHEVIAPRVGVYDCRRLVTKRAPKLDMKSLHTLCPCLEGGDITISHKGSFIDMKSWEIGSVLSMKLLAPGVQRVGVYFYSWLNGCRGSALSNSKVIHSFINEKWLDY